MRRLRVYASSTGAVFGAQPENYGDALMTPLLRTLFDIEPEYVPMDKAELIGVGSILDSYHRGRSTWQRLINSWPRRDLHVWGSGFMNVGGKPWWPQRVHIHAVRGPLSREKVGLPIIPLGDPALLLPAIWAKPRTEIEVAVVPHFATYREFLDRYKTSLPRHWQIVDLLGDPELITKQIACAEIVVSSSLHGLIVADAYNVPAIRLSGGRRIKGDGFKYRDYEAFRGAAYGAPISEDELFIGKLDPKPACPPSASELTALQKAFPFFCSV